METKYLDIHIIYSDKDEKYLLELLQQCKEFKIENGTLFKDYKRDITVIERKYRFNRSYGTCCTSC